MDSMDGYRGSLIPFGDDKPDEALLNGRVVDLASVECKSNVFLAVITDDTSCGSSTVGYSNPQNVILNNAEAELYKSGGLKEDYYGKARVACIISGYVAVGTSKGYVIVYSYPTSSSATGVKMKMLVWKETPPPRASEDVMVTSVHLTSNDNDDDEMIRLFVTYCKISGNENDSSRPMGVCCFDLGKRGAKSATNSFLARFDLDGRCVNSKAISNLDPGTGNLVVAQSDGLYFFTPKNQAGVAPIDDGVE